MKTRAVLTLEDVKKILAGAEAEAVRNKWEVAIVVLDDGGYELGMIRMDGATPGNAVIATEKARTSALTRRTSGFWEERIKSGRVSMLKMPNVLPVQGGVPIMKDGFCLGAVGVSGVQSHEDEQIAEAGIKTVLPG